MASLASVSICGGLSMSSTSCDCRNRSSSAARRQPETLDNVIGVAVLRPARRACQRATLRWGSISSTATRRVSAKAAARLATNVDLPAPPFCCAAAMTIAIGADPFVARIRAISRDVDSRSDENARTEVMLWRRQTNPFMPNGEHVVTIELLTPAEMALADRSAVAMGAPVAML